MSRFKTVWSDELGDMREKNVEHKKKSKQDVDSKSVVLEIRRLTSGKGRVVLEISNLPEDAKWCKSLASECKKKMGVGGTYKKCKIELTGDKLEELSSILDAKNLKWKKIGG